MKEQDALLNQDTSEKQNRLEKIINSNNEL
jgi:hypothetical protein